MKPPKKPKAARKTHPPKPSKPTAEQPVRAVPIMLSDPLGAAAEAIGALRTRIQSQHLQSGRRALAICAPSPDVGCTFVTVNLAVALSQIGIKTLLIDSNLRDPSVQNYFDVTDASGGLRACLSAPSAAAVDFAQENVLPNLDVIFAGPLGPNAQELIAAERFSDFVNECMRDYDMTIMDTPAASRCADSLRISSVAGFSLIVARKNRTMVSDLRALSDQLKRERVTVVGSVLNTL